MKKKVQAVLNIGVEIALYLLLLPTMLNLVINRMTGINVPIILMSVILGILVYTPDLIRLRERKERNKKVKRLLRLREEALRKQTLLYLIQLFNSEITERDLSLEDYDEALSILTLVNTVEDKLDEEEKQEDIKERIIQFILKERKRN